MTGNVIRKVMQKILRKRIVRNLKDNKFRYIALCFLIILGMYMVIRITGAADTIIKGVGEKAKEIMLRTVRFLCMRSFQRMKKSILKVSESGWKKNSVWIICYLTVMCFGYLR